MPWRSRVEEVPNSPVTRKKPSSETLPAQAYGSHACYCEDAEQPSYSIGERALVCGTFLSSCHIKGEEREEKWRSMHMGHSLWTRKEPPAHLLLSQKD